MTSERIICSLMLTASMMCGAAEPFQFTKGEMPEIVIQEGLRPFVAKAAEDVAGDLEKIFGVRAKVTARGDARPPVAARGNSSFSTSPTCVRSSTRSRWRAR